MSTRIEMRLRRRAGVIGGSTIMKKADRGNEGPGIAR